MEKFFFLGGNYHRGQLSGGNNAGDNHPEGNCLGGNYRGGGGGGIFLGGNFPDTICFGFNETELIKGKLYGEIRPVLTYNSFRERD